MKQITLFLLSFSFAIVVAQNKCQGVLLDSANKEPIEFANIGIIGKGFGTVTNEKGEFNFIVHDSLVNAPIKISMIGYKAKTLSFAKLNYQSKILLSPTATTLNEVAVTAKKSKIKILGNETQSKTMNASFVSNSLGTEFAIKLNIKHPKTQLRKFYLNITQNALEKPIFRFNLYTVDKDGKPKNNILTQNIIIEVKEKTGLIDFDLKPYNLFIDEDVFVAIEWIKDLGDTKGLMFSAKLIGTRAYIRNASHGNWDVFPVAKVGMYAEVAY